jgi:electron transfer flavoprotein alpha subunit
MLYKPSTLKLISGSRRTGSIGELKVPGDHQIPAKPCSPTPSTRPNDPYLTYNQPGHQKKPTNESFPTPPSPPRVLENSSSTTIPTTQAAAAATPQAAKLASIVAQSHGERTRTRTMRSATSPSTVIDTTRPRAPSTSSTAVKKPAAANPAAQLQAKQAEIATEPRKARTSTTTARDTTGTATIISAAKSRVLPTTATTDRQPAANAFATQQTKRKNADAKLRDAKLSNVTERNTPTVTVAIDAAKPWHALWTTDNTTTPCASQTPDAHRKPKYQHESNCPE